MAVGGGKLGCDEGWAVVGRLVGGADEEYIDGLADGPTLGLAVGETIGIAVGLGVDKTHDPKDSWRLVKQKALRMREFL